MATKTHAGQLTSRILLQQEVRTPDGSGGFATSWATLASPWARVIQTGGGEEVEGGQDPSRRTYDITVRRRAGLGSHRRVCWGSKVLTIESVREDDDDREFAVLECVEDPGAAR